MKRYDLEDAVDTYGMEEVLESLATIAQFKAEHIRENWPDDRMLAKRWDTLASKLSNVARSEMVEKISPQNRMMED